jgi:cadmium resistance protein CadD (predicted permease)
MAVLSVVALSVVLFASTNVDDLFILVGFFSQAKNGRWRVVAGQGVGIAVLTAASLAAAIVAAAISAAYVGLLGVAPLAIGFKKLTDLLRRGRERGATELSGGAASFLTVATMTIANGGDNLGAYAPLFATQTSSARAVSIAVFALMTLLWCFVALFLVDHPTVGAPIRRYGQIVLPLALIALGIRILYSSGAAKLLIVFLGGLAA